MLVYIRTQTQKGSQFSNPYLILLFVKDLFQFSLYNDMEINMSISSIIVTTNSSYSLNTCLV